MKKWQLANKYQHSEVEAHKYEQWLSKGLFKADPTSTKPPFSVILPPPNVTGKLHLGHAWDGALQDALIRFKKLTGFETLYLPGMDHAGIATQAKVEAKLRAQNISRFDLGREKFIDQVWEWKEEYSQNIRTQWATLGLSLDYSMETFTLDPHINDAVNEVFVDFYQKGLIYKDKKIVNWDPIQKTAISNIEVIYKEVEGKMYYFKYTLVNSDEFLIVATTRPETMFGDVCLVVNPNDARYTKFIGQKVINPVNGDVIEIIADDYVEIEFGTGVMKCTPAHDQNDFELGVRHQLAKPICMNVDGTINDLGGKEYQGLDRMVAREKIVLNTTNAKTLIKIEEIVHQVGFSERSDAIVEPYLSNQWFVNMKPLAAKIIELQASNDAINFFPPRFEQVLATWMDNIHDWTISRQLWWGHQIPAWYNKHDDSIYVGIKAPSDLENWTRDDDVLDTWFSSGLWPFVTLQKDGNKDSDYLTKFYPTSTLVTGYDIIFFWVARMIFQSLEQTSKKPFHDVLIHGLVRDELGRKMSKSLGNGIDPMEVVETYGTDALRFFLLTNSTPGQDIKYSTEKVRSSWNFVNKLWNASRYVLMNLDDNFVFNDKIVELIVNDTTKANDTNKWIISEFNQVQRQVTTLLNKYEFALAGKLIYDFVWTKYCSWFIEFSKVNLSSGDVKIVETTKQVLVYVLKNILLLLHPFIPFVTEEIYQQLNLFDSILKESWTTNLINFDTNYINDTIAIISTIREFKHKNNLKYDHHLFFSLTNLTGEKTIFFTNYLAEINLFLKSFVNGTIALNLTLTNPTSLAIDNYFLAIESDQFIDQTTLLAELMLKQTQLESEVARSQTLLSNENFLAKASIDKIKIEKTKQANYQTQLDSIKEKLAQIKGV